jgi:hypothetical protein
MAAVAQPVAIGPGKETSLAVVAVGTINAAIQPTAWTRLQLRSRRLATRGQARGRGFLLAIAGVLVFFGSGPTFAASDESSRAVAVNAQSRPFPVVEVQVGDVPFVIPKDWVDSKFLSIYRSEAPFINAANADLRRPPRSTHFEFPQLSFFTVVQTAPGLPARNLRDSKAEWDRRWPDRQPDQDGFWQWKHQEYALVGPRHARPLDQPLVVRCTDSLRPNSKGERRCAVSFYWTLATGVTYDFYDTNVPQSKWVDLDRRVIELLQFLDGHEPWPR